MSQSISFQGTEEVVTSKRFVKFLPGIHEVEILNIYHQPVGDSVVDEKKKDGSFFTFDDEVLSVIVKVLKTNTIKTGECVGAEMTIRIKGPKPGNDKDGKPLLNSWRSRIVHIFANMAKTKLPEGEVVTQEHIDAAKEAAKKYIQGIEIKTFGELASKLQMFTGRSVRAKFVATDAGKATIPGYYGGFMECVETPFEKTVLYFDASKEGVKEGPANAEIPTRTDVSNWSVPSPTEGVQDAVVVPTTTDINDLPF